MEYLERRAGNDPSFTYEVIVVNDGSKDNTVDVAMGYVRRYTCDRVRLLNLEKNRGKGGAVRMVTPHIISDTFSHTLGVIELRT